MLAYGRASTLYRTLVRERQVAQDVVAYAFPIVVGASMLVTWATARPGIAIEDVEEALHEETMALRTVETRDVERAVHLMETAELSMLQQMGERADQLSMFASLFDDPGRINTELDRIRAVRADEVRAFAEEFLIPENRAVLTYVPAESKQ